MPFQVGDRVRRLRNFQQLRWAYGDTVFVVQEVFDQTMRIGDLRTRFSQDRFELVQEAAVVAPRAAPPAFNEVPTDKFAIFWQERNTGVLTPSTVIYDNRADARINARALGVNGRVAFVVPLRAVDIFGVDQT